MFSVIEADEVCSECLTSDKNVNAVKCLHKKCGCALACQHSYSHRQSEVRFFLNNALNHFSASCSSSQLLATHSLFKMIWMR